MNHRLENFVHPDAGLPARQNGILSGNGENVLDLPDTLSIRAGKSTLLITGMISNP